MVPLESMDKLSAQLQQRLESRDLEIPMLPRVATDVVRLTQDPESGIADLAKLIQQDQSLAAHVMRVANSAAYNANGAMISLQQAMARLGMANIAEIALSACVNSSMFCAPGYEDLIDQQLKFSLACGLWAKEIARSCRKNVEAAFLAGLLHDIGKPVTIHASVDIAKAHGLVLNIESLTQLVNSHHTAIGMHVVTAWQLPDTVCSAIDYFHRYRETHASQALTMMVVAAALISELHLGESMLTAEALLDHEILADLNIYPDQIGDIVAKQEHVNKALGAMATC